MTIRPLLALVAGGALSLTSLAGTCRAQQYLPPDKKARQIKPVPPPKDQNVLVLFSGKPEEMAKNWRKNFSDQPAAWKVEKDAMVSGGGDIVSRQEFTDFFLHIEFLVPYLPKESGQHRGNSGVGLQSRYEIQVLDSSGYKSPGTGDCGAIYNQAAPLVNACKPPEQWQTYDITFRAPRFDAAGNRTEKARVTVLLNGVIIQNNVEIDGPTGIGSDRPLEKPGPIHLQDHGTRVQYRNIWAIPLPTAGSKDYDPK